MLLLLSQALTPNPGNNSRPEAPGSDIYLLTDLRIPEEQEGGRERGGGRERENQLLVK